MAELVYHTATDQRVEQSAAEQAFIAALQAAGVPVVPSVKLGQNWVFDGAVDGTRILIEFHGGYWHQIPEVKQRDARKQAWADREGYLIVTVWEEHAARDLAGEVARVATIYAEVRAWQAESPAADPLAADRSDTPPAILPRQRGDWRDRFLGQLSEGGIVREACVAAGVSRDTAYRARADDESFAADWRLALQDAADKALAVYRRRATQQSDRAMEFFIRSRDPEPYREVTRQEVTGQGGGPIELLQLAPEEIAARVAALVERAARRAAESGDA